VQGSSAGDSLHCSKSILAGILKWGFWGNGQVLLVVSPFVFFAPQKKDCRVLCATSECKNVVGFAFIACKFIFFNLT
jgi:hypothetical protein